MTAAAAAVVLTLGLVTGCGSGDDTAAAGALGDFAEAIERQDVQAAAELTTSPAPAAEALGATFAGMGADAVDVEVDDSVEYSDGTASFSMTTTWSWGDDASFESRTRGIARELSSGWRVQWEPALIYRDMAAGARLQRIRTDARPAPAVDSRSGKAFMRMEPVNEIVFDPAAAGRRRAASVAALARSIEPIAPLITARTIEEKIDAANGGPVVAVVLRDSDMGVLASDPEKIRGVTVNRTGKLVMVDRRLSSPLEDGLTNYWTALRDATAGWQVQLLTPGSRPRRLGGEQGPPAPNIGTSIDQNQQLVLGDAVVDVAQPATMMTLDASTGGILGMAQNDAAAEHDIRAGTRYPTGSTLEPLFAAAQKRPGNVDDLLYHFGLGAEFTAPGVSLPAKPAGPRISPADYTPADHETSMLEMAALGVSLARAAKGQSSGAAPFLVKGVPTKVDGEPLGDFDGDTASAVLDEMKRVAETGDASDLTGAPGLQALVGTNGPQGPGWLLGIQGGRVLVIYCEGEKSGTAALQVAQKYFRVLDS